MGRLLILLYGVASYGIFFITFLYLIAFLGNLSDLPMVGAYVTKTLTGSLLWVSWKLVAITVAVYLALIVFHYRFRDKIIGLSENPEGVEPLGPENVFIIGVGPVTGTKFWSQSRFG